MSAPERPNPAAHLMNNPNRGRPVGSLNKTTREAREAARRILDSPEYKASIMRRIGNDTLPPAVEVMLWNYRYGKPKENVSVSFEEVEALAGATDEQLESRVHGLLQMVREVREAQKKAKEASKERNQLAQGLAEVMNDTDQSIPAPPPPKNVM